MHILAYSERGGGETVQHRQSPGQRDGTGVTTVVDITSLLAPQSNSQDNNHTDQALHARQHTGTGGGGGGGSYLNLGS